MHGKKTCPAIPLDCLFCSSTHSGFLLRSSCAQRFAWISHVLTCLLTFLISSFSVGKGFLIRRYVHRMNCIKYHQLLLQGWIFLLRMVPFPCSQYCCNWCHLNRNSSAMELHLRWQVQRHVTMVKQADRSYTAAEGGNTLPSRPKRQTTQKPMDGSYAIRCFKCGTDNKETLQNALLKSSFSFKNLHPGWSNSFPYVTQRDSPSIPQWINCRIRFPGSHDHHPTIVGANHRGLRGCQLRFGSGFSKARWLLKTFIVIDS